MALKSLALWILLAGEIFAQEAGTKAAAHAIRKSNEVAATASQGKAIEEAALPFAGVKDYATLAIACHQARIQEVAKLYDQRETVRIGKGKAADKQKTLTKLNARIETVNNPLIGYLPDVTSASLITLNPTYRTLRVVNVVDKRNAIMRCEERLDGVASREFWLAGVDTNGWIDGSHPTLEGLLIKDGTKSYETEGNGNRTISKMKLLDMPPADKVDRHDDVRQWNLTNGRSPSGALVIYDLGKLKIKDMSGNESTIKWVDLSDADKEYVRAVAPVPRTAR